MRMGLLLCKESQLDMVTFISFFFLISLFAIMVELCLLRNDDATVLAGLLYYPVQSEISMHVVNQM